MSSGIMSSGITSSGITLPPEASVQFTPSRPDEGLGGFVPVMFYHIPRTGGLSFYSLLRISLMETCEALRSRGAAVALPLIDRFDREDADPRAQNHDYALVATHNAFGFHRRFRQRFLMVTIGRHPVARVGSDYAYISLRRGIPPEPEAFQRFFRTEESINRATKQLSGQQDFSQPLAADGLARALETLHTQFDAYVPDALVTALTSHVLSRFCIANVLSDRINATRPQDRLDTAPWHADIAGLNAADLALFDHIATHPRLPGGSASDLPPLHPLSVVFQQSPGTERAAARSRLVATPVLTQTLREHPGLGFDLSPFFPM